MRQALDVVHIPYPNKFRHFANDQPTDEETISRDVINWLENRVFQTTTPPEEVAGIILEVVQGEGGDIPAPRAFVKELRRICDQHGIMLIVDEVQSGMGRTGKMFALDHHPDVKADIIARGTALGLDYALTVSCYQASDEGLACGRCDSCRLRRDGFAAAGTPDPTRYGA